MDFRKNTLFAICLFSVLFFVSCTEQEKSNIDNTYYIDLVNFNHDSLRQNVSEKIFGKVSFYKNDKLEILSVNYLTCIFTKMQQNYKKK